MSIRYKDFLDQCLLEAPVANTILADINELYCGYILNGDRWYDEDAKFKFESNVKLIPKEQFDDIIEKSKVMVKEFKRWAIENGYSGGIERVWYVGKKGVKTILDDADVSNPSDILVKYKKGPSNGYLGMSAKISIKEKKSKLPFNNPSIKTIDSVLNTDLYNFAEKVKDKVVEKYSLPQSMAGRSSFLRDKANSKIKNEVDRMADDLILKLRDKLFTSLNKLSRDDLSKHILKFPIQLKSWILQKMKN